ncbi:MAG: nucleotidyltransferase domain-containing protein [Candidatus Thorarchaeota archaeon]
MEDPQVREQFEGAVSSFVERATQDKRVLGIILFGSMAYDEVTERSNIDMMVVTDEGNHRITRLIENGVPIDIRIYSRNDFMRRIQRPRGTSILQFLANKSKLLFSRDCSFTEFYNNLNMTVGKRDRDYLQITYYNAVIYDLNKSEKFLYIKNDLAHSFHSLIHGLSELGYLLCYLNDAYPPREVVIRGRELLPELYPQFYDDLIESAVTKEVLEQKLRITYEYMDSLALDIFKPILDYISENDGTATETDILAHFRPRGLPYVDMEHLHRRRILRRTVAPVKLTKRGRVDYQESQYHFDWDSFNPDEVIPTHVGPHDVERSKVHADYEKALNDFVERAKSDEYILSVILGGSLSYDTVWEKSDIDLFVVTRDELQKPMIGGLENDVMVYVYLFTRDQFRKQIQRVTDGSPLHSTFNVSKIMFTRDETIHDLYEDMDNIGSRDLENLVLLNYIFCKDLINKAYKAIHVKEDPRLSIAFIMSAIRRLANIEVLLNRKVPLRESTVQALELNPELFNLIFTDMITSPKKDMEALDEVLRKMEMYLWDRLETIAQPVMRLLEQKEEVTYDDLKTHFSDIWLPLDLREFVDMGLIEQTEAPLRFTKKSSAEMMQPSYQLSRASTYGATSYFI